MIDTRLLTFNIIFMVLSLIDLVTDRPPPPSNFCIRKIMGRRKFLLSWECFDAGDSNQNSKIEGYQVSVFISENFTIFTNIIFIIILK